MMRSQKGKALSWIVFICLVAAALGLLWFFQKKPAPLVTPGTSTQEPIVTEEGAPKPGKGFAKVELSEEEKIELDNEAMSKAFRSGKGCDEIKYDEALRQKCLDTLAYDLALQNADEKLCEQIKDEAVRQDCLDRVYMALAVNASDPKLCEKIKNEAMRKQCQGKFGAALGRSAASAKECDGIVEEKSKQECVDNFLFANSVQNLSAESCDSIKDPELKSRCSQTVTKNVEVLNLAKTQMVSERQTTEQALKGCDALAGDEAIRCKDQANYEMAKEKRDLTYCNQIKDSDLKNTCMGSQSAAINNYYLRLATAKKDPTLCAKILDEGLRATCLTYTK